ncbi:MAG: hypothetical protein K9J30_05380 [Bacteroidales bacterium]|nr:hypothetical protein [Bacteroidales bacterium]
MKKAAILLITVIIASSCSLFEKPSMSQEEIDSLVEEKAVLEEQLVNLKQDYELLNLKAEECAKMLEQQTKEKKAAIGKYSVIIGSFKNMKYAKDYSVKVKGMGGLGNIIAGPYDFNLVVYTTHATLREAAQSMYKARENLTDEAWIYMEK